MDVLKSLSLSLLLINATIWPTELYSKSSRVGVKQISPASQNLHLDTESCKNSPCSPIFGVLDKNLSVKKETNGKINLKILFEYCSATTVVEKFEFKKVNDEEYLKLYSIDQSAVEITCGTETRIHTRVALLNSKGFLGISLRKINNEYSHLGTLHVGLLLLPKMASRKD
jgi:hypothetical protein